MQFIVGDVSRDVKPVDNIDMLVTLHACDTATDYALHFAIDNAVPYVFSVPCCQHEVNLSVKKCGGDLDMLLEFGLIKERVSALLTDTVRAQLLKACGYEVDVVEFVDMEHSPKNIMLRATLNNRNKLKAVLNGEKSLEIENIKALQQKYMFRQTLLELLTKLQKSTD